MAVLTGLILFLSSCSTESRDDLPPIIPERPNQPVNPQPEDETLIPIDFASGLSQTRATNPADFPFQVWGLKSDGAQSQVVFDDVPVKITDGEYHYDSGVRYWDYGMSSYQFFGYAVTNREKITFEKSDKGVPVHAYFNEVTPNTAPLYTKVQEIKKEDFGKKVVMEFTPLAAQLRIGFYAGQTDKPISNLQFFAMDDDEAKSSPILNCEVITKADYYLNILTNHISLQGSTKASMLTWNNWANKSGDALPTSAEQAWVTEFCNVLPNPNSATDLKIRMKYSISGTPIKAPLVATVPAPLSGWQPNKKYTYLFQLIHSSDPTLVYELQVNDFTQDDLSTFVGDLFKIDPWTNHDISEEFDNN